MNEPRSSRYHRARRRAGVASAVVTTVLLATLMLTPGSRQLRAAVGGSVAAYVAALAALHALLTLPLAWYRGLRLEHEYELSQMSASRWWFDHLKATALAIVFAIAAAEFVHAAMRIVPQWWWLAGAVAGAAALATLTSLAPVFVLPLFHRSRPLDRDPLRQRLLDLSERAGVPALTVHEWGIGEKTRRANAALVGAGQTRRILVSDTLLADYSEDEIEVVLAHELGHHVHGDLMKGLVAEFVVLAAGLYAASLLQAALWQRLGLAAPDDPAGLPLLVLALAAVSTAATPLLNLWSRRNERRADRFALRLASRPDAFVPAMRRMAAQNMAEERTTMAARWFFNTHPTVEERIGYAREMVGPDRS